MDALEKFGPGRPGGGGLDEAATEEGANPAGAEGEAGYVSPVEGSTDPEGQPSYEAEIEAESTGTSVGAETGSGGDPRDDVLTDALSDDENPDPTERR